MNNYDVWNHLILNHFFNDQRAGESVRLNVTEDLLNSLGSVKNWNFEHFLDSLKEGSCFVLKKNDYTNICKYAEELYSFSKNGTRWPRDYIQNPLPPYVAILSFFVYLTTLQDPDNNSYYRRLWGHFPVDNKRDHAPTFYPGFENMRELWKGLQEWSNSHNLGNFNIEVFDNFEPYQHLSIPKSQAILTENERQNLPRFFASAGLRSNTPMNFDRWRQAINDNPRFFMSLTVRALDDVYLSNYLIEDLNNELKGWDNNTSNQHGNIINHQNITQRSKSQKLILFFDNNIRGLFPRLKFNSESFEYLDQVTYSCQNLTLYANLNNNWSNLYDSRGRFDASTISWITPFKLQTENSSAPSELSFEPKQIRVFVSTSRLGLSGGYFEVDKLPSMGKCLIAFYQQKENEITEWFNSANLEIIFENKANLPEGWKLLQLNNIPTEQKIREKFPGESESQEVKFNFIGGFKYKLRGRVANKKYYWFFPPYVELHGEYAGSTLACNDNPMKIDPDDGIAKLPENLGAGIFTIKMISNGVICSEDVIELVDVYHAGDPLRFYVLFDKFGFAENNSKGFTGSWLEDSSVSNFEWDNDNQINRTVSLGGVRWGINPGSLSQEFINDGYGCKNYPLFYFYDLNNLNSDAPIQERKKSGERISEFHEQNGLFPPEKGLPLSRLLQFKNIMDRSVKVIDSNHGHMHAFLIPDINAIMKHVTFLMQIDAESSGCFLKLKSDPREDQFPHCIGIYNDPAPFNQNPPQNFGVLRGGRSQTYDSTYQLMIMPSELYWSVNKVEWGHNKWDQVTLRWIYPECCKVKQLRVGPWDVEELFCYLGLYEFLLKLGGNINVPSEISLSKDLDGLLTEQKGFANIHKRVINSPPLVPKVLSIKGSAQAKVFELPEYLDMPSSVKLAWRLAWIDRRVAWEGRTILNKVKIEHQLELRKALLIAFKIDDHSWAKIFTCCLAIAEYLLTIFIKNGLGKIIRYDEHPEFLSDKTNV